jgi:uncharacterized protein YlxW (UPF0749 family)
MIKMTEIYKEATNQSKMMYEAQKEEIFNNTLKENKKLNQEIKRLNNIINNLENELARVYEIELDYPHQFVKEEIEKVKLGIDE